MHTDNHFNSHFSHLSGLSSQTTTFVEIFYWPRDYAILDAKPTNVKAQGVKTLTVITVKTENIMKTVLIQIQLKCHFLLV